MFMYLAVLIFVGTGAIPVRSATGEYPIGDVRNCPTTSPLDPEQPLYRMDVLPGTGYDALRDIDMGQVFNHNYSLCRVSSDGKYLLPDYFYLFPIRQTIVEEFAEYFDHWSEYSSLTSQSVHIHSSYGLFSRTSKSFSAEHTAVKSHMVKDNSSVARIHLRKRVYSVHVQSNSPLNPDFKTRLFEIAAYLDKNITDHAHYLAELLIRDYGTHYLTSVEAGAIISLTDFISKKFSEDTSKDTKSIIISSAHSILFGLVTVGSGFSISAEHEVDAGYRESRTFSLFVTLGGPSFQQNLTIDKWAEGILDALVTIDRSSEPLHFVINSNTMPELRHESRAAVADIVYEAINRYFKVNTHAGCTNPKSQNFDFRANVDDGNCESVHIPLTYTFGGAYQRCTAGDDYICNLIGQTNPLTNDYTCPDDNYIPVKIFSGKISIRRRVYLIHHYTYIYVYEAYWCVAKSGADIPVGNFVLFGGFYTSTMPNPLTNTMGCPQYFIPLKLGNYISVCVSTDYEKALQYAVSFGGFETCQSGNPLAMETFNSDPNTWPHQCPHGYTSYFGGVEHGCDINMCIKSNAMNSRAYNELLPPKLPPFHHHPSNPLNDSDLLSFVGSDGNVWTRNMFGKWSHEEPASQCYEDVTTSQQEMHTLQTGTPVNQHSTTDTETTTHTPDNVPLQNNNGLPVVAITLPTVIFGVLIVCIIALVIIVLVRRFHKHRHGYDNMRHCHVNDQPSNLNTPA